jgi:uncharacterized 2Fe-2S/4Fe-4S cluster protein (DUF4445 family)
MAGDPKAGDTCGAFNLTFQPSGRRGSAAPGQDLLSVARALGVEIESTCGGKGTCKKCRVHLESPANSVSPATEVEERALEPRPSRPV